MNNLDIICDKILSDARSEADAIIAVAEENAAAINAVTLSEVEALVAASGAKNEKACADIIARADGTGEMKAREIILKTKVGLISRAFDEARARLLGMEKAEYVDFLAKLLASAVLERLAQVAHLKSSYKDDEETDLCVDFSIVLNARDKQLGAEVVKAAKAIMHKRLTITVEDECADISGGLILRYGDIESNCSIEAVIAEARSRAEA